MFPRYFLPTHYNIIELESMEMNITACCPASGDERWWIYLVTSAVILVVGLSLSVLSYAIYLLVTKSRKSDLTVVEETGNKAFRKYRETIRQFISGDTLPSKILITLTFVCNIIYLIVYIYRTYTPYPIGTGEDASCQERSEGGQNATIETANQVEKCFTLGSSPEFIVEIVVVLELIFYAFIRFLAADDVVHYWLDIYTLVDVFTLPHIFVSLALGVDWVGLRSLRFIWLPKIVNVIRFLPFVRSQDAVDVTSLLIQFFSLWLSSTGIIHLIELQGDFWRNFDNASSNAFLSYAYFMMVTFSTVGYGDISPATASGRAAMILFIIIGLAFFAAILPTIVDLASSFYTKRQFAKFDTTRVPQHVIVCGHITAFSAEEFVSDFLHPDRGDTQTHVLFLHPERPDPDLKNVIRSHYTRVQYIVGSVLNSRDLRRARIHTCKAVFVICDKLTNTPLEEDNANLLRLVSVKNTTTKVPVIIQLLLSTSKKKVRNIEGWTVGRDIALCLNQLKLGLLAQSCICPGISTLVANWFYTSDLSALNVFKETTAWKKKYTKGISNEIYTSHFSKYFEQMSFHKAAELSFNQLGLILISVEKIEGKVRTCYVNPSPESYPDVVIESGEEGMLGYFIGQDSDHVSIVASYCGNCHRDLSVDIYSERSSQIRQILQSVTSRNCHCERNTAAIFNPLSRRGRLDLVERGGGFKREYKTSKKRRRIMSTEHSDIDEQFGIYVCEPQKLEEAIVSDENVIETTNPMPDIKDHVVLCVFADETSPLLGLHNFLLPLRSKYMPKDQLKPVVIVSNKRFIGKEWRLIRNIPDVFIVVGSPLRWQNLKEAKITQCSVCIVLSMLARSTGHEPATIDKESILCSLSIREHLKKSAKRNVLIITDLRRESNVQFLDFGDEDEPDERIYKAQPFACGETFSVSMFDSVTSSAFHSPGALYLIEDLIHASGMRTRPQVIQVPLTYYAGKTYAELYNFFLKKHAICLGLYRRLPQSHSNSNSNRSTNSAEAAKSMKHYVITAPSHSLRVEETDLAFLLVELTPVTTEVGEKSYI